MAWSGGTFTRANPTWTSDAGIGIGIEAGRHDAQDNDFTTGINQCLNKDGSNSATGNLNLGGYLPTNIGAGTAAAPAICAGNDVDTGMFSAAANQIGIATNGTEKIRIDASGNVGLGTTTPGAVVDVHNALSVPILNTYRNDGAGSGVFFQKSRSATVGTNTIVQNGDALGSIYFNGANGTGYSEAALIRGAVDGTPGATNDMPGRLQFYTTPDGSGTLTERMRISSNGTVGIGGASRNAQTKLDVKGVIACGSGIGDSEIVWTRPTVADSSAWQMSVRTDVGGSNEDLKLLRFISGALVDIPFQIVSTNGKIQMIGPVGLNQANPVYRLQLGDDSAAKPTTNTWIIASDARIKTNVVDYPKGLAEICQIRPITYDYNGKGGFAAGPGGVSVIAQEIQPVFPECVGSFKGKLEESDEDETDILNYNGHAITFALINAVKELNAKVEALEARVLALEA